MKLSYTSCIFLYLHPDSYPDVNKYETGALHID